MNELIKGVYAMVRQTKDPRNKNLLNNLPEVERITYELFFHERVRQRHIAKFMRITQGGVSHRLKKSMKRLNYVFNKPVLTTSEKRYARKILTPFIYDLCVFMVDTTCQTVVADMLNKKYKLSGADKMNQIKVRHRFKRALDNLTGKWSGDPKLRNMRKLVEYADGNNYMMHWVSLPQFKRKLKIPKNLTKHTVLRAIGEAE
jgi:hypothetical protein